MKRLVALLTALFMLVTLCVPVLADTEEKDPGVYTKAPNGYSYTAPQVPDNTLGVYDFADLLSDKEESSLRTHLKKVEQDRDMTLMILTSKNVPYDPDYGTLVTRAYAEDFFEANMEGLNYDALIFIIDMRNRVLYTVGYGRFSDLKYMEFHEDVYNAVLSPAKNGDYYKACEIFLNKANRLDNPLMAAIPTLLSILISLGISGIVMLVLLIKHSSSAPKNKDKVPVPMMDVRETHHDQRFIGKNVTRRKIETSSGGGGGFSGGGGSSGGGHSTSGGGGHF
ncbi:MAG: TPM domain-containing protein [Lachnospiraceae bacterium]|nr:TPM domain-containing protein [Lachnospiraceae bacterium]